MRELQAVAAMHSTPRSAYDMTGGMMYFARMLDKIRLHANGELRDDFHANLGKFGDGWCSGFLRVNYADLQRRVLEGGTDEEILEWCFTNGRQLDKIDLFVWNSFVQKLGWNDVASPTLERFKAASGLADRQDIVTLADYFEVDEGRKA